MMLRNNRKNLVSWAKSYSWAMPTQVNPMKGHEQDELKLRII